MYMYLCMCVYNKTKGSHAEKNLNFRTYDDFPYDDADTLLWMGAGQLHLLLESLKVAE